jgi:hypothetical protein
MEELEYQGSPQQLSFGGQNQAELIKYLDPNVQRQKLMIQLFNLEWNEKKQSWIQKDVGKALIKTHEGKLWIENLIGPFFTVSSTTNRLKHNQIVRMIHDLIGEYASTINVGTKRINYGIDISDIREVGNLITRSCFLNLSRSSERGIDVNLLNQNVKFVESRNIAERKGGSFLGNLNPLNAFKK